MSRRYGVYGHGFGTKNVGIKYDRVLVPHFCTKITIHAGSSKSLLFQRFQKAFNRVYEVVVARETII